MTRTIRPIRIEGNVAYVPLTKGYEAVIDVEDVPLVETRTWWLREKVHLRYAISGSDYYMHRMIIGAVRGENVDHIDGNGLNNRRINLRIATHMENMQNRITPKNNTSGVKGVHWASGKWRALITYRHVKHDLGRFDSLEDAKDAYNMAAAGLFGPFHRQ